ncbi:hypothetical protein E3N88_32515 [Mikania micrantha]|uniref:Aminotransferase-like plant mobile domain-containing protein n=1 Tax=Mikania micrantha TaxID=192012 RepID=A0A5N6M8L9_9ASTR|nr:hypothetical protein E3N88_32515 [Mikania micrantha]
MLCCALSAHILSFCIYVVVPCFSTVRTVRNLCKATHPDAVEIAGPVYLLQLWALERSRTVLYITNLGSEEGNPQGFQNDGGAYQLMMNGLVQIYQTTRQFIGDNPERHNQFQRIQDIVHNEFGLSPQHHMDYTVTPDMLPPDLQQHSSFNYFAEYLATYEQPRYSDVSPTPLNLSLGMSHKIY